jgi:hypothetical protein
MVWRISRLRAVKVPMEICAEFDHCVRPLDPAQHAPDNRDLSHPEVRLE